MIGVIYLLILAAGGAIGLGVAFATRPTFLGIPVPLEVMFSDDPLNMGPRQLLWSHFTTDVEIGLGVAFVVASLMYLLHAGRTPHQRRD